MKRAKASSPERASRGYRTSMITAKALAEGGEIELIEYNDYDDLYTWAVTDNNCVKYLYIDSDGGMITA